MVARGSIAIARVRDSCAKIACGARSVYFSARLASVNRSREDNHAHEKLFQAPSAASSA
jgi:hypothetical protein